MASYYQTREPGVLITMFRMRPRPSKPGKLTQHELATLVQRDPRALREWESGLRLPQPESLMRLIHTFLEEGVFLREKEHAEAKALWDAVRTCYEHRSTSLKPYPPFDEAWFEGLLQESFQSARTLAHSGEMLSSGERTHPVELSIQALSSREVNRSFADLAGLVFTETFSGITCLAFSPNGQLLAVGTANGEVRLWRTTNGRELLASHGHRNWVIAVAFSPDGSLLASAASDQSIKLWDSHTCDCYKTLQGHSHWVSSLAFSPDGALLASGSQDETVKLWDVQTGACVETLSADQPYERMNITGVVGLTETRKASLKALGDIEDMDPSSTDTPLLLPSMAAQIQPSVPSQREQGDESERSGHKDHPLPLSQRGRAMTKEASLPSLDQSSLKPLSKREFQVLLLIAQGASNQEIARHLVVAPSTVKSHLKKIYEKLHVQSRTQAIARARAYHLL